MLYIINGESSINPGTTTTTRNFVPILLEINQDMMGNLCVRLGNRATTPKRRRTQPIYFYCFFLKMYGVLVIRN